MRWIISAVSFVASLWAMTDRADALVYQWTENSTIVGTITGTETVTIYAATGNDGHAPYQNSYLSDELVISSENATGQFLSLGVASVGASATVTSATGPGYDVRVFTSSGTINITDEFRYLVQDPPAAGSVHFNLAYVSYEFLIDLPEGLTLLGQTPAVPEPSTWAMIILGFSLMAFLKFGASRRPSLPA